MGSPVVAATSVAEGLAETGKPIDGFVTVCSNSI